MSHGIDQRPIDRDAAVMKETSPMPTVRIATSIKRLALTALAMLAAVLVCSPAAASAAPVLSFSELTRTPTVVHANDELVEYTVRVTNTGDATTSGQTILAVNGLPAGARFGWAEGPGWTCNYSASLCTTNQAVTAGNPYNTLTVSLWLSPESVPDTIDVDFSAFGGGASNTALGPDSFAVEPAKPFEILAPVALACFTGGIPEANLCGSDFAGGEYATAGGHPVSGVASMKFPTRTITRTGDSSAEQARAVEDLRDIVTELPAGFIGNLNAADVCTFAQVDAEACPESAAVGGVWVEIIAGDPTAYAPLFRIVPEDGYVAAFAFNPVVFLGSVTYIIRVKLRSNGDYGVTAFSPLPPQGPSIVSIERATLCGYGANITATNGGGFQGCKQPDDPDANAVPFLTNPTRCGGAAPQTTFRVDSYDNPASLNDEALPNLSDPNWKSASVPAPSGTDCQALTDAWTGSQTPSFTFQPDTSRADAPAGYTANLHIPQDGIEDPDGVANSHLKDTVVTLPEGLALNPSAADGLEACTLDQAGYLGNDFPAPNRIRFNTAAAGCPQGSKVGTAVVETPVLEDSLPGSVYLAAQKANPFGSDFAVYLVVDDPRTGIKATIPGRVDTDPQTGRITSTFVDNPQAPVEDVELKFFSGPRASLANPDVCGAYPVATELSPWSAVDPYNPTADELATPGDSIAVDTPASDGAACPATKAQRPFGIGLTAGMTNAKGGSYSPFTLRLTRPGGSQELDTVEVSNPKGLVAKLAGIPYCSEQAIAQAVGRTATGDGKLEQASPSCPEASKVGTTTVGAGAGDSPIYVKGGIYLAGPYKGAPVSLAFVVPAVAGPFDLGVQVVRTALHVDRKSAKVTAVSDGIPQILRGVPVRVRDVRVDIDRPGFTLNPSDCSVQQIDSRIAGNSGAVSSPSNGSQPNGCAGLAFKPKLTMRLTGRKQVRTGKHPGVRAQVVQTGVGEAGIEKAVVRLPKTLALDVNNAQALCEFVDGMKPDLENHCPKGSIVGRARAKTPLLDNDLVGNVYFVKNVRKDPVTGNEIRTLPMIVVALRGQIQINLYGESDTTKAGKLVNTFAEVPDAPISKFNLNIKGGSKGILAVTRTRRALINLCAKPNGQTAEADMDGHNGRRYDRNIRMKTPCTKRQTKNAKRAAKRASKARKARG